MKKITAVFTVVLVLAMMLSLAACGSSPEGKYVVKSIDGQSVEDALKSTADASGMSVDDLLKQMNIDKAEEIVTMELKSDGKAVMDVKMFSTTTEGTWKQDGEKIAITIDDQTNNFTFKNNELTNDEGDQKYVFVKK